MYLFIKRLFDICSSFVALVLLSWLLIPICIILLCTGEHEVFYFQKRIGMGGKTFGIWKYATMLKNSEKIGTGTTTVRNDPRVLPVGRFLRKTKLNELPQLVNILIGDMSVVGPRPLVPKEFDMFSKEGQEIIINNLKPGLTGIGSIVFRDEEYFISQVKLEDVNIFFRDYIQPLKEKLEIWYYQNRSLYVDFMIILVTAWVVLRPESDIVYKVFKTLPRTDLQGAVDEFLEKRK